MASPDLAHDVIVRWNDADPGHIPLLREGGVTAIIADAPAKEFTERCANAGITVTAAGDLRFVSLEELDQPGDGTPVVLEHGLWPGAGRPPEVKGTDYAVAGASRQPWIDANLHWVAWLKALYPDRPAVLGYLPDRKAGFPEDRPAPFETLELALVEARAGGGNYILAVEPRYRAALLEGDAKALAAWRDLGRTARWLRANNGILAQPTVPVITVLVEAGEETAEIANLMFRQNGSPALAPAAHPPPPDERNRLAIVAVGLHGKEPGSGGEILAHARAGSTVVLDDGDESGWWRDAAGELLREEHDRGFYRVGGGQLVAYKEPIQDPSDFALDVIDLVDHEQRAVRLWGAATEVGVLKMAPAGSAGAGDVSLVVVNYGTSKGMDILVRVRGNYGSARLVRPESGEIPLETAKRGTATEVVIPELRRVGIVVFK